jgi:hypothetical protein
VDGYLANTPCNGIRDKLNIHLYKLEVILFLKHHRSLGFFTHNDINLQILSWHQRRIHVLKCEKLPEDRQTVDLSQEMAKSLSSGELRKLIDKICKFMSLRVKNPSDLWCLRNKITSSL